ncbi:MAG: TerC family protein [Alphaproteobacteria bacterium]|nr:TerC family protein [Alphaproteobacteria bacterium]
MEEILTLAVSPQAWIALATLIVMEVVLGIDNLVFVSILTNKLPEDRRAKARTIGIGGALILRLLLLSLLFVLVGLTDPVFGVFGQEFSWRDIILIAGGLFLVWKSTTEIHHSVDPEEEENADAKGVVVMNFGLTILQILALDIVFSLDSILTAVGMTPHLPIMICAVIVSVILMLVASGPLARFIEQNPTVVMLALGFLLMIGMLLIADGFGVHVPKGYVYAAIAFSGGVEALNILARRARKRKAR